MENKSQRLLSLDALRGFDMMMIIGIDVIAGCLAALCGWPELARQFDHPEWFGLSFYDTIFPLFLFIAGISFPFSYAKQVEKGVSSKDIHLKILKRFLMLFLLGLVTNAIFKCHFHEIRYGSVLCKIGQCWAIAALLYIHCSRRTRIAISAALVIVYAALQFVVAPDAPPGTDPMSLEGCFVGWLDRLWMPGALYQSNLMEPSGFNANLFSTITAMLGMFAGEIVRDANASGQKKTVRLVLFAAGLLVFGLGFRAIMPFSKRLWNPAFSLTVGAYSAAIFALFYYVIDVLGFRRWTYFFTVVGTNAITIYMLQQFVDFDFTSRFFFGGIAGFMSKPAGALLIACGAFAAKWLVLRFLYEKKVFLKV